MKIHVQDFAIERVMLDFLDEGEAPGARIIFHDKSTSRFSEAEWWMRSPISFALISRFCGLA